MKDKILEILVRRGAREDEALEKIDNNYEAALKISTAATPGKLAEIITRICYL
jgi:hypothetical protein